MVSAVAKHNKVSYQALLRALMTHPFRKEWGQCEDEEEPREAEKRGLWTSG